MTGESVHIEGPLPLVFAVVDMVESSGIDDDFRPELRKSASHTIGIADIQLHAVERSRTSPPSPSRGQSRVDRQHRGRPPSQEHTVELYFIEKIMHVHDLLVPLDRDPAWIVGIDFVIPDGIEDFPSAVLG